jgi:alpha-L-fucosidase
MTPIRTTAGDSSWFTHDRFGMFIHWGLYSAAARHEWVKSHERLTDEQYERYFKCFEPDLYNPDLWAQAAADAGMKYFVITTKHHDGFCLWDSKLTEYKSTVAPNCRRDLLTPMVKAFRKQNFRTGFYHSLLDWHHPHYVIDAANHPQRELLKDSAIAAALNAGRDQMKYADYLHGQVKELLTEFGDIDVLWFDFSFVDEKARTDFTKGKGREAWRSAELLKMIRTLQPRVLLDNRLNIVDDPSAWDFATPEQAQPCRWVQDAGQRVVWEACQTLSGSWGYHRDESSWRSVNELVRTLIDCVSKGGNLLLNVGPTGRGDIDSRALACLRGIGKWMHRHSRSIYGCTEAPPEFIAAPDTRLTYNPEKNRIYVHLLAYPYKHLHLDGAFCQRVEYAQFLNDASELKLGIDEWHGNQIGVESKTLVINLPQTRPDVEVPVIEFFLKDA